MNRVALWFVVCVVALVHTWVLLSAWQNTDKRRHAADFASYYYAVRVAADGANPYDNAELVALAKAEGTRDAVYPYLYPPPFLLTMAWALPLDLFSAYLVWFWVDEAVGVLVLLILWRWWKEMGPGLPIVLLGVLACSMFVHNHFMGQVNLPVLAAALAGAWLTERGREGPGGALIGLACMLKMSPALFVLWWMVHGKWRAVGAAAASAVLLSVATLPLVGLDHQWSFYRDVLPTFGNGEYGGLTVNINLFANHSLPSLYDRLFPGDHKILGPTAQILSTITALAIAGGLLWAFRKPPQGLWATGGQVASVCIALLLVPVYTYEHHLVWEIPALVLTAMAMFERRLPVWCAVGVAYAWFIFAFDIFDLQDVMRAASRISPLAATLVRESKLIGLLVMGAMTVWLGTGRTTRYARPVGEAPMGEPA